MELQNPSFRLAIAGTPPLGSASIKWESAEPRSTPFEMPCLNIAEVKAIVLAIDPLMDFDMILDLFTLCGRDILLWKHLMVLTENRDICEIRSDPSLMESLIANLKNRISNTGIPSEFTNNMKPGGVYRSAIPIPSQRILSELIDRNYVRQSHSFQTYIEANRTINARILALAGQEIEELKPEPPQTMLQWHNNIVMFLRSDIDPN